MFNTSKPLPVSWLASYLGIARANGVNERHVSHQPEGSLAAGPGGRWAGFLEGKLKRLSRCVSELQVSLDSRGEKKKSLY